MPRTFTTLGVVLKRVNIGESDRIVTILTKDYGKYSAVAKGVRKLSSSRGAALEPGSYVKAFFVQTKSLPLLTQAVLIEGAAGMPHSLSGYRNLSQILEIFEKLFVEEALEESVFEQVLSLRKRVMHQHGGAGQIRRELGALIEALGFQHPDESDHETVSEYLESLLSQQLRSFEFLSI